MYAKVLGVMLVLGFTTGRINPVVQAKMDHRTGLNEMTLRVVLDPVLRQMAPISVPDIANISLSPWTYRESRVASRVPRVLFNAQCLTRSCLSHPGGEEDAALQVKPIKYQVLVLHRIPSQKQNNISKKKKNKKARRNKYKFRLGTEIITVGCTCVRPVV
uniref:interleukin 17a/f3 n=1 Tax=Doryrhamphus excisus TaxID=161450 RepID=UPI0025AE01AE|nr:interleukin 17a/f3 [Doryrhamphus excisus]